MSVIGKVLRAAIEKPWEHDEDEPEIVGDGAPDDMEFRVSPDGYTVAMWLPDSKQWVLFSNVVVTVSIPADAISSGTRLGCGGYISDSPTSWSRSIWP